MKLESQVVSLELAKRLKELGVKQESYFYWTKRTDLKGVFSKQYGVYDGKEPHNEDEYAALTVGELGEMLPSYVCGITPNTPDNPPEGYLDGIEIVHIHENGKWISRVGESFYDASLEEYPSFEAGNEAEARGLMLEYLIKNELVQV